MLKDVWMQMQQIIMQMQQYKTMTNGVIYNVYMLHVMTFQSTDVFMQMDSEPLMKDLMLQRANLMVEYLVKVIHPKCMGVRTKMPQISMKMQMWMMVLVSIVMYQLIGMLL